MTIRRRDVILGVLVGFIALAGADVPRAARVWAAPPPSELSNAEFWRLASGFSEPDGTFHSDNLVSNETRFPSIVPTLAASAVPGRAYVGVGSEQNFTYIAATRPALAFIVDLRRGNFDLHLTYKALFEMSESRADFVSLLFSRARPAGLGVSSSAREIFDALAGVPPDPVRHARNLDAILTHLTRTRRLPITPGDREGVEFVYRAWFERGPDIQYQLNMGGGRGRGFPSYADLMSATDDRGVARSFLADEDSYRFVRTLHRRNLILPVVGNFGGPKALRAVGGYLRQQRLPVSAFYTSNVEQYLRRDGLWPAFCENAATLPVDGKSLLIRSMRGGFGGFTRGVPGGGFLLEVVPLAPETASCAVP